MQRGTVVKIGKKWFLRYWEKRNIGGVVQSRRVSHCLGPITTRGKRAPADIKDAAHAHMATVNGDSIRAEHVTTIGDFVEGVFLPWVRENKRPSTVATYAQIWKHHLGPVCSDMWLKNVRTFDVQGWLKAIGSKGLGRNSLKHIKAVLSGIFKLAAQQDYFHGANPVRDATNPKTDEPTEMHAYSLEELNEIFAGIP